MSHLAALRKGTSSREKTVIWDLEYNRAIELGDFSRKEEGDFRFLWVREEYAERLAPLKLLPASES